MTELSRFVSTDRASRFAGRGGVGLRLLGAVTASFIAACSAQLNHPEAADGVCAAANEYVALCTGSVLQPGAGDCQGTAIEHAEAVLSASCEELSRGGKADGADESRFSVCVARNLPTFVEDQPIGSPCCYEHNCGPGLTCREDVCAEPGGLGDSCERATQCDWPLACTGGRCETPRQEGEACDQLDACERQLACNTATGTCASLGLTGEPCGRNEECAVTCIEGLCSDPSEDGGSCDPGDNLDCANVRASCEAGRCTVPAEPAAGDACDRTADSCGLELTCWDGRCEERHGEGGACEVIFDCSFGLFCIDDECTPA